MSKFIAISCLIAMCAAQDGKDEEDNKICMLSKVAPRKPYPSLSFCFRQNVEACCLTAHDQMIADSYGSFMPSSCSSQFTMLEQLQCIGCHPSQPRVVEPQKKIVKLCRAFVENLYVANDEPTKALNIATTKFDSCGFLGDVPVTKMNSNGKIVNEKSVSTGWKDFSKSSTSP